MNPDTSSTLATRPSSRDDLEAGSTVGRYVVLGLLGRGVGAEVYAGYDPELDRKIAIKLLHPRPAPQRDPCEIRPPLLREAQVISKLSDPNVVVMFDVGMFGDRVFLAMELIDGQSLADWIREKPRTWRDVVTAFTAAGMGLGAAHRAGFVHRDFKAASVMVARDGQIRVMDFGLARSIDTDDAAQRPVTEGAAAHMAPELLQAGPIDARADQFSFCVALYEALYGEQPFDGAEIDELVGNVCAGRIRDVPAGTRVPAWLRRVLVRGLRANRADRYPSMAALLSMLGRDPVRATRRWMALASILGLGAVLVAGLVRAEERQNRRCRGAADRLSEVWELPDGRGALSPRKDAIRRAFMATGKAYAADAFDKVKDSLDRYVTSWSEMHRETCEATSLHGKQAADVLDLRMSCLQDRFSEVRALTSVFRDASGDVVSNAVRASQSLGAIARCADIATLRATIRPPDDPAVRRAVAEVRSRLADVRALVNAGSYKRATEQLGPLMAGAERTAYPPVVSESLLQMGEVQLVMGEAAKAELSLERALWMAESWRHDQVVAEAAADLIAVVGYLQARYAEAERWGRYASAVLARAGSGNAVIDGWRANNLSLIYEKQGRFEEAIASAIEAVALKTLALGGDHFDVGISQSNVALALSRAGRLDEAMARSEQALRIIRNAVGADHPQLAFTLTTHAEILNARGRYPEARDAAHRAVTLWEREAGSDQAFFLSFPLTAIGASLLDDGQPALAIPYLERALRIREASPPEAEPLGETRFALARALWAAGRHRDRAMALAERARADYAPIRIADKQTAAVDRWIEEHAHRSSTIEPPPRSDGAAAAPQD